VPLVEAIRHGLDWARISPEQLGVDEKLVPLLLALEQSPASIVITDQDGNIQYVNAKFLEITGYSREELLGQNPRLLKSGLQDPSVYEDMWRTLASGRTWSGQLANRRKDGSIFWEKALLSPIQVHGRTTHYLGVKEDITRMLETEQSRQRLLSALDHANEGVAYCTPEGRLIHANPAFHALLGCGCEEVEGEEPDATSCRLAAFLEGPAQELMGLVASGELQPGDSWRRKLLWSSQANAAPGTLSVTATLVKSSDLRRTDLLLFCRDISHEEALEQQLHQGDRLQALGTLVNGITHDFNNVLTAIQSATELMRGQLPPDHPLWSKVEIIRQAVSRARDMNRRILTFSRPSRELRLPFDLSALTRECVQLLAPVIPKNQSLASDLAPSCWMVGDPAQVHQVLMNLATNAIHAMEEGGGRIHISLGEANLSDGQNAGPGVLLRVQDTGCGMDSETLRRACDPFFTTKPSDRGTGLGLSVVHGIVQSHGGKLSLQSQPEEGTEVQVWFPAAPRPLPQESPEGAEETFHGSGHVLIVDLEEIRTLLTKEMLQGLGYRVTTQADPVEALREFRQHPSIFDAVVLEYSGGKLPAASLARQMKNLRKDLPVLQISGSLDSQGLTPSEILASPFDEVLSKPFTTQDIGGALQRLLQARASVQAPMRSRPTDEVGPCLGKVLVAEDSAMTLSLLRSWLTKAGYEVVLARDGQEAWDAFKQEAGEGFSLVLSDYVMPRKDGIQLAERIREVDPDVPFVLLSSSEDTNVMRAAVQLQVSDFLPKPFQSETLLRCVEKVLRDKGVRTRSAQTAEAVRQAQKAMVALSEPDMPLYSLHQSLTDAGGDVFRGFREPDGSILLLLADVAGHSVISSYAVAAFLGLLTSLPHDGMSLRQLAERLNTGIQQGPFSEVPVCVLLGRWNPATGRLHVLNAGLPHGVVCRKALCGANAQAVRVALNGTPLGIFSTPLVEETVLMLEPGDRVLFGTDGIFDLQDHTGVEFEDMAGQAWTDLRALDVPDALTGMASMALDLADGRPKDDLMLVGCQQPERDPGSACLLRIESVPEAVDRAIQAFEQFLSVPPKAIPLTSSRRFDLMTSAREGLINALYHGNASDPDMQIWLHAWWDLARPVLRVAILDEGPGFDLESLPREVDALSERGRGIPFLRHCAQVVQTTGSELNLEFHWED
jgi:PAS domain S-box-containing protein